MLLQLPVSRMIAKGRQTALFIEISTRRNCRLFSRSRAVGGNEQNLDSLGKKIGEAVANKSVEMNQEEKISRVQAIMASDSLDGWDNCWKQGITPWDVGAVTPIIQHFVDSDKLPQGRAFIPGCGSGYDVLALANESRHVVGLDISETVIERARKRAAGDSRGKWVEFIVDDFFSYTPTTPFDLIFDYTFFCAINPEQRSLWASKMAELLSTDGELLTLMFPLDEYEGGPPFAVSVQAYEEVLNPLGLSIVMCRDNDVSVTPRKGREKVALWKRVAAKI